jgi:hypothetical protein
MVCEARCPSMGAPGRATGPFGALRKRAAMRQHEAEAPGVPVGITERGSCLEREEWRSKGVVWSPEEHCQSSPRREPGAELASVAMTGTLVGSVIGPYGLPAQVRLLVRDQMGVVVRECYPPNARTGYAGVRFEMRGLPADTYTLEVWAPGFWKAVRHEVRVEASRVTDVGMMRLMRANVPRITVLLRHMGVHPPFLHPPSRGARAAVRRDSAGATAAARDLAQKRRERAERIHRPCWARRVRGSA